MVIIDICNTISDKYSNYTCNGNKQREKQKMNEKVKKVLKIGSILIVGIAIGIIIRQMVQTAHYKKVDKLDIIGKIVINEKYINIREKPSLKASKVGIVNKGETYELLEVYEEEYGDYIWYKVMFNDRRIGWVASDKETEWIGVIK